MLYKVEEGSVLYKSGVMWTEYMRSRIIFGKHDISYMVISSH